MSKETNGYYLEKQNISWLEQKAKQDGRSASNFLDRLLTKLREGEQNASN